MIIIGITGTLGAGKGTIVDYLVTEKQFVHFSARTFLSKEVVKKGLPLNRDNFTKVANDLRTENGASFVIESLYAEAEAINENSILESVRTLAEIEFLRKKENFYLFAVDADPELRYERIRLRASETDHVSFEKFIKDEQREMKSVNPSEQNLQACIEKADFTFLNNRSIQDLEKEINDVLIKIGIKNNK